MKHNPAPINNSRFRQGVFSPKNPQKCINLLRPNDFSQPIYRSSWEKKFMIYCDLSENILFWGCEVIMIPYESRVKQIDGKAKTSARYYVDFYCETRTTSGKIVKQVIEVKPQKEIDEPQLPKRRTPKGMDTYKNALRTYATNQDKWNTAETWCKQNGMVFIKLSERDILKQ